MTKSLLAQLALIFLLTAQSAKAQIFADKSIFYWASSAPPVKNLALRNSAEQPLMVEVKIVEVINPGTPEEKLEPSEDVLASPKRFSVPAKGERTVRLLRKGEHGKTERVFRISFIPQARDDETEGAQKSIPIPGTSGVLKVLTGVGILVFSQPAVEEPHLTIERKENSVILTNEGNVNIAILKLRRCTKADEGCEDIVPKRLYPGNTFVVPDTAGKVVFIRKRIGDNISEENVP
jgi:P pilus assembly chaperone PapD